MTLIKSISGIRGTIGGKPDEGLNPVDIVKYSVAYGIWLKEDSPEGKINSVVIGRDARISGEMMYGIISGSLLSLGINVINLGMATTPTVEMAVINHKADGGIIITASHNPGEWNALKLLNRMGEFLPALEGEKILLLAQEINNTEFESADKIGKILNDYDQLYHHIDSIIALPYVNADLIRSAGLRVAFDCVNSVGGISVPLLLRRLGVDDLEPLYCDPTGIFPHNPEPLEENLTDISKLVVKRKANVGFVVDPDVDRLAIICEDGSMFGEEYTLVAIADHILGFKSGNTVSNLSSTRALHDITEKHGGKYFASAVGEVNVVAKMKETDSVIGGEGNGGVILPDLHYGRDALLGIALFLTHLINSGKKCSDLRSGYPDYFMSKKKIVLDEKTNHSLIFERLMEEYKNERINNIDGVKIDFDSSWVHIRMSNTEPIIRIYTEAPTQIEADNLASRFISEIGNYIL